MILDRGKAGTVADFEAGHLPAARGLFANLVMNLAGLGSATRRNVRWFATLKPGFLRVIRGAFLGGTRKRLDPATRRSVRPPENK